MKATTCTPSPICAGCEQPTTFFKPICDACIRLSGGVPMERCLLCEEDYPLDATGLLHQTKGGTGYAGRCTAVPVTEAKS